MDPSPGRRAWGGAAWIGGGNDDLVLYAPYLAIFDVKYALAIAPGSTRASFVYGANDSRLMDRNKNIQQVQNAKDQSYIKLELDISALGGSPDGKAKLHVYRAGYKDTDTPSQPLKTFDIDGAVITNANKHAEHTIEFRSAFGQITLTIDGSRGGAPNAVNLNPVGQGGDYLPFGMLCDIGFSVGPGPARDLPRRRRPQQPGAERHPVPRGSGRRDVHGHLCGRRQGECRPVHRQRHVRAGGRHAPACSSCGTPAATRCRCSGPRSRRAPRRSAARDSMSRRAASTRSS